ncbi:cell wall protein AWA1-like [Limulus polyphemus]|uniref:Cell wall protein AWA1-like n=1 Tax=Limulus polyphemus TaxID=6850 RepID=A0ABM1T4Z0_LIMPO|nr:cell wall protein AWA1-like [Limulus polyphemus]XP_022250947.1 cell wall protein AWA1-like [Limulus polyphemus]
MWRRQHPDCFSEEVIVMAGGETFKVHRNLLAQNSEFFKALLNYSYPHLDSKGETGEPLILPSVSALVFSVLLEFLYTGRLNVTNENIYDVLVAAQLLNLPTVILTCKSLLAQRQLVGCPIPSAPSSLIPTNFCYLAHIGRSLSHLSYRLPQYPVPTFPFYLADNLISSNNTPNILKPIPVFPQKGLSSFNNMDHPQIGNPTTKTRGKPQSNININSRITGRKRSLVQQPTYSSQHTMEKKMLSTSTATSVKSFTKKQHPQRSQATLCLDENVIIDYAECDGPIKFERVINQNYHFHTSHLTSMLNLERNETLEDSLDGSSIPPTDHSSMASCTSLMSTPNTDSSIPTLLTEKTKLYFKNSTQSKIYNNAVSCHSSMSTEKTKLYFNNSTQSKIYNNAVSGHSSMSTENTNLASGSSSLSIENNNIASGSSSLSTENNNIASGSSSLSTENNNIASGSSSLSTENNNIVSGSSSLSTENNNIVSGSSSLSTENNNIVSGSSSLSTENNIVSGSSSLSTENTNTVSGSSSLSTENTNTVSGSSSLSTENTNTVSGSSSLSTENTNTVSGSSSLSTEKNNIASGSSMLSKDPLDASSILPTDHSRVVSSLMSTPNTDSSIPTLSTEKTKLYFNNSTESKIYNNAVSGQSSISTENTDLASGSSSLSKGNTDLASGSSSLSKRNTDLASGSSSLSKGNTSLASGSSSLSKGNTSLASGSSSLSKGNTSLASGSSSLSKGNTNLASGSSSLSKGNTNLVSRISLPSTGNTNLTSGSSLISTRNSDSCCSKSGITNEKHTFERDEMEKDTSTKEVSSRYHVVTTVSKADIQDSSSSSSSIIFPDTDDETKTNSSTFPHPRTKPGHDNSSLIYHCVYCKHSFRSKYCYEKHKRRHINPVMVEVKVPTDSDCSVPRPPDKNVAFYPCKNCGSKFPSYYFVHKHRKHCPGKGFSELPHC